MYYKLFNDGRRYKINSIIEFNKNTKYRNKKNILFCVNYRDLNSICKKNIRVLHLKYNDLPDLTELINLRFLVFNYHNFCKLNNLSHLIDLQLLNLDFNNLEELPDL